MFNNSNELFTMNDLFTYSVCTLMFVAGIIVGLSIRRRRPVNKDKERMDWLESVRPDVTFRGGEFLIERKGAQYFSQECPSLRWGIDRVKGDISG